MNNTPNKESASGADAAIDWLYTGTVSLRDTVANYVERIERCNHSKDASHLEHLAPFKQLLANLNETLADFEEDVEDE